MVKKAPATSPEKEKPASPDRSGLLKNKMIIVSSAIGFILGNMSGIGGGYFMFRSKPEKPKEKIEKPVEQCAVTKEGYDSLVRSLHSCITVGSVDASMLNKSIASDLLKLQEQKNDTKAEVTIPVEVKQEPLIPPKQKPIVEKSPFVITSPWWAAITIEAIKAVNKAEEEAASGKLSGRENPDSRKRSKTFSAISSPHR